MIRMVREWVTIGLTALFVFLAVFSLTLPATSAAQASAPPCHRSTPAPSSPDSHGSDHSCCAVGHNHVLLASKVELPLLQLGGYAEQAIGRQAWITGSADATVASSSPPLSSDLPIRI